MTRPPTKPSSPSWVVSAPDDLDEIERLLRKPVNGLAPISQTQRITVLARKTYNVLLWLSQRKHRDGEDGPRYYAPLSEIVVLLEFNSNQTSIIKGHLTAMVQTIVQWQSPTEGEGRKWEVSGLLAWASIEVVKGQVIVGWEFSSGLREEIMNPSVFALLRMEVLSQLRTHQAVFLYELASRYIGVGRSSRRPWQWWHDPLTGRPPDPERLDKLTYAFFKRDVIKPAIAEINAITEFEITLMEYRKGRFITDIQFLVARKPQQRLDLSQGPEKADLSVLVKAREMGLSIDRMEQLVDQYGVDAVAAALPELKKRIGDARLPPVRDVSAYFRTILPVHAERTQKAAVLEAERKDPESSLSRSVQKERQDAWRNAWRKKRMDEIEVQILALSAQTQLALTAQLLEQMKSDDMHPQIIKRLERNGWRHDLVKEKFIRFYAEGAIGMDWDQPSESQILAIASHLGDAGIP